ncbi:MAG TPA: hypothetical protein VN026_07390 [Bacteroidia bacterium]|jgi:hypothetical protein|nr:hypothetical protein [Bacteroidia bacterium]
MKKLISIKTFALLGLMLAFTASAQDSPKFYSDNGTKEVTGDLDCASLNDLLLKIPIPPSAFKYDKVELMVVINLHTKPFGESNEKKLTYGLSYEQKKFDMQFGGKTETSFWLVNKGGKGDFLYEWINDPISKGDLCGSTKKEKVDVEFTFYGYIKTSENKSYTEYNNTWNTIPVYDEGTLMGKADLAVLQKSK